MSTVRRSACSGTWSIDASNGFKAAPCPTTSKKTRRSVSPMSPPSNAGIVSRKRYTRWRRYGRTNGHTRATSRNTSRERRPRASGNANSLAGGGAMVDSKFNRIVPTSLAGSSAGGGQYVVFENELRCASYFVLVGAEPIGSLEIRRHGCEGGMPCRFFEFDLHRYGAVVQLVDHLNRAGLAESPLAPGFVVDAGQLRDEGARLFVFTDQFEIAQRRVCEIFF